MGPMDVIATLLAEGERSAALERRAERQRKLAEAPKKVVEGMTFAKRTQEPCRGMVVLLKGSRKRWTVTQYDWKKGARVVPYGSRYTGRSDGEWKPLESVTHLAIH